MASVAVENLSKAEHDELCCAYSALLLEDGGVEITADNLLKIIKASGNQVEGYWPSMFANALKGVNISDMLTNISSGPAVAASAGAAAAPGPAEDKKEDKKEEKEEEEEVVAMGGLFGGEEDYY